MRHAMRVEVGPEGDQDRRVKRQQLLEEPRPLRVVLAYGEGFLELVDDQEVVVERPRGTQPVDRIRPGRHQRRVRHAREVALMDARDDARSHERGLAAARSSDDGNESMRRETVDKVAEDSLATEEQVVNLRLECKEAAVRADGGWGWRAQGGCRE